MERAATTIRKLLEFENRYTAMGIPLPDPETMCRGRCEGTGVIPIYKDEQDEHLKSLWLKAEEAEPTDDGYHFITCPDCNGTRLKQ